MRVSKSLYTHPRQLNRLSNLPSLSTSLTCNGDELHTRRHLHPLFLSSLSFSRPLPHLLSLSSLLRPACRPIYFPLCEDCCSLSPPLLRPQDARAFFLSCPPVESNHHRLEHPRVRSLPAHSCNQKPTSRLMIRSITYSVLRIFASVSSCHHIVTAPGFSPRAPFVSACFN